MFVASKEDVGNCLGRFGAENVTVKAWQWIGSDRGVLALCGLPDVGYLCLTGALTVSTKWVDSDWKWKTWYLTLKPWGPVTRETDVSVSERLYQQTQAGDTVCVFLRSGAFRIPWYQAGPCSEAPPVSR